MGNKQWDWSLQEWAQSCIKLITYSPPCSSRTTVNVVTVGLKTSDIRVVSENISLKATSIASTGLNLLKVSMERLLECYDRDAVRNTMLKHEEIFRQQVHELHRLYRDQKMLMAELGNKETFHSFTREAALAVADTRTRIWSTASTSDTIHYSHVSHLHQSAAQLNLDYSSLNPCNIRAGPSSRELSIYSLEPSSMHIKGFDLEQPPAEDYTSRGATSINDPTAIYGKRLKDKRSLEGPPSRTDDGSEIELTLSIGCSSDKKKQTHRLPPNTDISCSEPSLSDTRRLLLSRQVRQEKGEECGDSSTGLDRENLKSPPWLLRAFNVNKT